MSLWEAVLPPELLRLPEELARVDALLDDPAFFGPFGPFFDPRIGRPSTPMETYLRLMFLKFRYRLGYESLCREVQRFDHLAAVLPDPVGRCGAASDHADEADHPVRAGGGGRVERGAAGQGGRGEGGAHQPGPGGHHGGAGERAYPTDSGLLAKAVRRIGAKVKRIQAAGGAVRTKVRDRSRAAGRRRTASPPSCGPARRPAVRRPRPACGGSPGSWPSWPQPPIKDAERLLVNAHRALRRARAKAAEQRCR